MLLESAVKDLAEPAAGFAVLARAVGLPTRLVVGFRPTERDEDGLWVIRGRVARATHFIQDLLAVSTASIDVGLFWSPT